MAIEFSPGSTAALFAATIISSLAPLLQAKILGEIVNNITNSVTGGISAGILILIFAYAAIWAGTRILNSLELYTNKIWRVMNEYGTTMLFLKKRSEVDLAHYETPKFQDLIQRVSNKDIWPMVEMTELQFTIFANIVVIATSSFIASSIDWKLYIIVILVAMPSFFVQFKYGHKVWSIWSEHSERKRLYTSLRSHLLGRTGVTQSKLLQNSSKILELISGLLLSFQKDIWKADRERLIWQVFASVITASGFGLAFWMIVSKVTSGDIEVGTMVFVISALGQLVGSLNNLMTNIANQLEKNLYVNDMFVLLDTRPFIKRAKHPIKLDLRTAPIIEFRNVSFKYEGSSDQVLKNLNITFNPGEKIALVGMNGAGKTTLVKLLGRIYDPTEGNIYINRINLMDVDPEEWSKYLSILLQDYKNYDLKVGESIAMGRVDKPFNLERIRESSEYTGASEFIEKWENKYEQRLGKEFEGGVEPSHGQNQKITLARTIYREGLVVVLDEPTASIDALSEMKIFEQMEKAAKDRTLIVITHRFNTTKNFDRIIVIENGEIVENGPHKELIKLNGKYAEMFESQAKAFRSERAAQRRKVVGKSAKPAK